MYSGNLSDWIVDGYWESVTAQSGFMIGFIAPACAVCAAWEGARLRSSGLLRAAQVRSPLTVAAAHLLPTLLLGIASVFLSLLLVAPAAWGQIGGPSLDILGLQLLVISSHIAVGYVLGLSMAKLIALPLALIGSFVWMAYPASMSRMWVRQLNGHNLIECCSLSHVVDTRALVAPALVAVGVMACCLVMMMCRSRALRLLALLPVFTALAAGYHVAKPLGYEAAKERDPAALACEGGTPVVCLWPEQQNGEDPRKVHEWGSDAGERLTAAGVPMDLIVTFSSVNPTEDEVRYTVAGSPVWDVYPECATRQAWLGGEALGPLQAWLALTAGVNVSSGRSGLTGEELDIAQSVSELEPSLQADWFDMNLQALGQCEQPPPLDPALYAMPDQALQAAP